MAPLKQPATRKRARTEPHPTATLLLESAVELLDVVPIDQLTTGMVLERSGVSSGSLYHFYADISDLVEQAVVRRYTRRLTDSLAAIGPLLESRDRAEFRDGAERLIRRSLTPETVINRLERVEVLGALQGRPRLSTLIAHAQQQITDAQAELFVEFQQRGWLRADLDARALSGFVQAVLLGQIVNEITERPVDPDAWARVVLRALESVLFPD